MTEKKYDVLGIGNAIVDVVVNVDEAFIHDAGLSKGTMTLIDAEQAAALYDRLPPSTESSGGSAANTIAGLASLGADGAYIGKVRDDQLGEIFRHDIRALGVGFDTVAASDGPGTARCMVLVTEDADRTLQTYLGACVGLAPSDVDEQVVSQSEITYLEGYLWDPPEAKKAFVKAADIAHKAGRRVALSLSDPFCVDRHRDAFKDLVNDHVDIVFANEEEAMSLYQVDSFDDACAQIEGCCDIAALTRGAQGSVVVSGGDVISVGAAHVDKVVDTTGAGDAYAGGFLYGLTHGASLQQCAQIGGIAAAEVISHFGARPACDLAKLVKEKLG